MWLLQALVELVEFHQHAGVALVEAEGAFHIRQCFLPPVLLVEARQREVAPDGRELRVEPCRQLPVLNGHVVLPLVVIQATEVIGRPWPVGVHRLGHRQHDDILQTVGEAAVAVHPLCLFEGGVGSHGVAQPHLCPP